MFGPSSIRHISSIVTITFVTEITDHNRYTRVLGPEDGKPFPHPRRIFENNVFSHSMIYRNFLSSRDILETHYRNLSLLRNYYCKDKRTAGMSFIIYCDTIKELKI